MKTVLNYLRVRSQRGQAMIEFLIIFWFAFSFLMLVIQISLMFNAHSMMKLAAFNAARAAIVTRSGDGPEKPVKLGEMKDAAKKAAFLTILPVIPGLHAQMGSFGQLLNLFTSLPADLGSALSPAGASAFYKGHGRGLLSALVEYLGFFVTDPFLIGQPFFKVKFVGPARPNPLDPDAEIDRIRKVVEFDDTSKNDLTRQHRNNLIKVVVEWHYPLVIPLADQIIYAYTHVNEVATAYALSGQAAIAADVIAPTTPFDDLLGRSYHRRPVWEVGWVFRETTAGNVLVFGGFRVPIRTSYVMRMQWDRGPDS